MPLSEPTRRFVCLNTNGRDARNGEPAKPKCQLAKEGTVIEFPAAKILPGEVPLCTNENCRLPLKELPRNAPKAGGTRWRFPSLDKRVLVVVGGLLVLALAGWLIWSVLGDPKIELASSKMIFPYVIVGAPKTETTKVKNPGTSTLKISGLSNVNSAFAVAPLNLKPGESGILKITFNPSQAGLSNEHLTLKTNLSAPNAPGIDVSGRAVRHDPFWIWSQWEKSAVEILNPK